MVDKDISASTYNHWRRSFNAPTNKILAPIIPQKAEGVSQTKLLSTPNCMPANNAFKKTVIKRIMNKMVILGARSLIAKAIQIAEANQATVVVTISMVAKLKV